MCQTIGFIAFSLLPAPTIMAPKTKITMTTRFYRLRSAAMAWDDKLAQHFAMALTLLPLGMLITNSTAMTMTAVTAMTRALHRDDDGHHDDEDQGPLGR